MCLDIGLIDKLITVLIHDDIDVKKEAIWALSNATQHALGHQLEQIVQKQGLTALSAMLSLNDPKVLVVAMEGIENILKSG